MSDPTKEKVFTDKWRDHCALQLTPDEVKDLMEHPERCHPDNRLLLISSLARRLHAEWTSP